MWVEDAVAMNFPPRAAVQSELGWAYIKEPMNRHAQTSPNVPALEL